MKFITGMFFGVVLTLSSTALMAQYFHPRITEAINHLRDAKAYMLAQPHDFGGHRDAAIRATDAVIHEMDICARFRR
jgi:hypothetical protein